MAHEHPPSTASSTISAALLLIGALDAEQAMARAMEGLYVALRDSGHPDEAAELERVQTELRQALIKAGSLVQSGLDSVAAEAPPSPES